MTITGVVTFIAAYHCVRIFESWEAAFNVAHGRIATTGYAFGAGHRYVDWLLTVPHMIFVDRFRREYLSAPILAWIGSVTRERCDHSVRTASRLGR